MQIDFCLCPFGDLGKSFLSNIKVRALGGEEIKKGALLKQGAANQLLCKIRRLQRDLPQPAKCAFVSLVDARGRRIIFGALKASSPKSTRAQDP